MGASKVHNAYMDEVMAQQAEVQQVLARPARRQRARVSSVPQQAGSPPANADLALPGSDGGYVGAGAPAVDVRVTGWFRWKRVIVPPNAHVVHTRLGVEEPLNCGMGVSFNFNPYTDSFLVVPAAMQTIMISAKCICKERQGILVQGYVQWIVDDFRTAYRKLDFSDPIQPMEVVNVQLREQAEAAIKDTVASMSIDDVLADKQPIVKVLTARLRQLAEGDGHESGLGLRIMTVQLKEAVVSSNRLWESLQRSFRAERQKLARLAELQHEGQVRARESEAAQEDVRREIESAEEISRHRAEAEAAAFDREQAETVRRARIEAETLAESLEHEKAQLLAQAERERLKLVQQLERRALEEEARHAHAQREVELFRARREVENAVSPGLLQEQLVAALPHIAEKLPQPSELKSISLGGLDGLSPLIEGLSGLVSRAGHGNGNGNGK